MPTIPFTIDALAGLALGVVFALLCIRSLPRAIVWYVALAWVPFFQVAKLSGSEFTTGFMQVEWLATILIAVWLLKRPPGRRQAIVPTRFNVPLLLLIPLSVVSLVTGFAGLDPAIDASHVKVAVSIGQILLFAWPIGLYFAVANTVTTTLTIQQVARVVTILAVPAIGLLFVPTRLSHYIDWSIYFALVASPFCFAESLHTSSLPRRVALIALALVPVVYGLQVGKALWYVAPLVAGCTIAALQARRSMLAVLPLAVGAYLLVSVAVTGTLLPGPLAGLVAEEEAQQSLGGRGGRDVLAMDTIRIWKRYPVFGVGPGNNYPYMDRYSTIATAHDQYLNILLEMGIVGLACYLAFVGQALRTGLALLRSVRERYHRVFVLGWVGLFAGMTVGGLLGDFTLHSIRNDGLFVFSWYYPQWVMLGLMVAIKRIEVR